MQLDLVLTSYVMIYDLTNQNLRFEIIGFLELVGVTDKGFWLDALAPKAIHFLLLYCTQISHNNLRMVSFI